MTTSTVLALLLVANSFRKHWAYGPVTRMEPLSTLNAEVTMEDHWLYTVGKFRDSSMAPQGVRIPLYSNDRYEVSVMVDKVTSGPFKDFAVAAYYEPRLQRGTLVQQGKRDSQGKGKVVITSDRMNLEGTQAEMVMEITDPTGDVLYANASFYIYPYSLYLNIPCAEDSECRHFTGRCDNNQCACDAGSYFLQWANNCVVQCTQQTICPASSSCWRDHCMCDSGKEWLKKSCKTKDCTSDAECRGNNRGCAFRQCSCDDSFREVAPFCIPRECNNASDCAFWSYMTCGVGQSCQCAKNTSFFYGSCTPNVHLGMCPTGVCRPENSICQNGICICIEGYELHIRGTERLCTKKTTQVGVRTCNTQSDCNEDEVCTDNVCRCPENKELFGLKCIDIVRKKAESNFIILLYVSVAFLLVVVQLMCFGCCLYFLAQRAENMQNALMQQVPLTEDFELASDT